jgi:hypothetical protein
MCLVLQSEDLYILLWLPGSDPAGAHPVEAPLICKKMTGILEFENRL